MNTYKVVLKIRSIGAVGFEWKSELNLEDYKTFLKKNPPMYPVLSVKPV